MIAEVRSSGEAGARGVTHNGLAVDFRVVEPDQFGNVLQHLTGSARHNVELREHAVRRGLHVSEYGVEDDESGATHRCATEHEVYELLGLDYVEPELREGARREVRAAIEHRLPELVTIDDLRGDLHCHTTLSDGRNTLEQMVEAARGARLLLPGGDRPLVVVRVRRGRAARRSSSAGSRRWRAEQRAEGVPASWPAPRSTSRPTGQSTTTTACSERLDWVVASVHSSFRMGGTG